MSYTSWIEAVKSVGSGEKHEPGDVWQTDAGWVGKRPDGSTQYGMKGKEKAQAYVAGKDVEVDEPEAQPEKEPEAQPEKEPKAEPKKEPTKTTSGTASAVDLDTPEKREESLKKGTISPVGKPRDDLDFEVSTFWRDLSLVPVYPNCPSESEVFGFFSFSSSFSG